MNILPGEIIPGEINTSFSRIVDDFYQPLPIFSSVTRMSAENVAEHLGYALTENIEDVTSRNLFVYS